MVKTENAWFKRCLKKGVTLAVLLITISAAASINIGNTPATVFAADSATNSKKATLKTACSFESAKSTPQTTQKQETEKNQSDSSDGSTLNKYDGVYTGPSGKESYYNMEMSGVVQIMRDKGYSETDYPYWIRDDGVKMFGDYVMVAAKLSIRPKGTILECSKGTAIVVDTGDFVKYDKMQLDVATNW